MKYFLVDFWTYDVFARSLGQAYVFFDFEPTGLLAFGASRLWDVLLRDFATFELG